MFSLVLAPRVVLRQVQLNTLLCCCVSRLNDIIVSVNGVTTVSVTHAGAVEALKRAGYTVDLVGLSICSLELIIVIDIHLYVIAALMIYWSG